MLSLHASKVVRKESSAHGLRGDAESWSHGNARFAGLLWDKRSRGSDRGNGQPLVSGLDPGWPSAVCAVALSSGSPAAGVSRQACVIERPDFTRPAEYAGPKPRPNCTDRNHLGCCPYPKYPAKQMLSVRGQRPTRNKGTFVPCRQSLPGKLE